MRLHPVALVVAGLAVGKGLAQVHDPQAAASVDDNLILHARTGTATSTAPPSTTSAAPAATHTIAVGATGFNFTPNNLTVAVGSVIEFNFYPGNHSVVRSAFKFPCIPYEDTGPNRVGVFSGFLNTDVYSSDGPKYRVRVNDSDPIFYYCAAPGSCITHGMLGVINPVGFLSYSLSLFPISALFSPPLTFVERHVDSPNTGRVCRQHDDPVDAR